MNKRTFGLALLLIAASFVAACGEDPLEDMGLDTSGSGDTSNECLVEGYDGEGTPPPAELPEGCDDPVSDAGPEEPVSNTPGTSQPVPNPGASSVEPQPGQDDVRPVRWESAKPLDDTTVKVRFWSGVEPCNVLDRVVTEYGPKTVTIALYEGHTPTEEDVACIELALLKRTTVELDEPLDGRKIVDGAR